jgi:hypothetical protein
VAPLITIDSSEPSKGARRDFGTAAKDAPAPTVLIGFAHNW